jgi:hypothetical protein
VSITVVWARVVGKQKRSTAAACANRANPGSDAHLHPDNAT